MRWKVSFLVFQIAWAFDLGRSKLSFYRKAFLNRLFGKVRKFPKDRHIMTLVSRENGSLWLEWESRGLWCLHGARRRLFLALRSRKRNSEIRCFSFVFPPLPPPPWFAVVVFSLRCPFFLFWGREWYVEMGVLVVVGDCTTGPLLF